MWTGCSGTPSTCSPCKPRRLRAGARQQRYGSGPSLTGVSIGCGRTSAHLGPSEFDIVQTSFAVYLLYKKPSFSQPIHGLLMIFFYSILIFDQSVLSSHMQPNVLVERVYSVLGDHKQNILNANIYIETQKSLLQTYLQVISGYTLKLCWFERSTSQVGCIF